MTRRAAVLCSGLLFAASCSETAAESGASPDAATDSIADTAATDTPVSDAHADVDVDVNGEASTDGSEDADASCLCTNGSYGTDSAALACFCAEHSCTFYSWDAALANAKAKASACPPDMYIGIAGWSPGCTGPRVISGGYYGLGGDTTYYDRATGALIGVSVTTDTWLCGDLSAKAGDVSPATCGDYCMLCADEDAGAVAMCPTGDAGP